MSLFHELKRRNVFRAAGAYVVVAWISIQVIETIFPVFGFGDSAIRIAVIVLAIGLLPVVVLAWAFELTPEGLKHEREVNYSAPGFVKFGKRVDRLVMVLLALGLAYFAFDKFVLSPQREKTLAQHKTEEIAAAREAGRNEALVESFGDRSIAVLPFVNMSDDATNEFFSDGISEELLNLLAKIPELRVTSRSSAFAFKGEKIDIPTVAEKLNVAHILEGSVRKAGNQVRITAQLIDAQTDTHVWSETYDRQLDDIFAIQDEIAARVVVHLKIALLGAAPVVDQTNPEAYSLVLQASYISRQGTPEGVEQALDLLNKALTIDPNYSRAWTELSTTYLSQVTFGQSSIHDSRRLALEAVNRALTIDPDFAPAHAQLGWIAWSYDNDLVAAARHYQRAIDRDPLDIYYVGAFLFCLGRIDEAIVFQENEVARDPVNANGHFNLGLYYLFEGQLDKALVSFRTALQLNPESISRNFYIGLTLLLKNETQAAIAAFSKESNEFYRLKGMAYAYHDLGQTTEFETIIAKLQEDYGETWPSEIAMVYAWIDDKDAAFQWLEKEIEVNGTYGWTQIPQDPQFRNLWEDPRWQVLLAKVGVSAKHLASIEFTVPLPE